MPRSDIDPAALGVLRATPAILGALFEALPEAAAVAPVDDGWSARDALAHLLDTEAGVLAERVRRMLEEDRPFIRSIDAPARLAEGGYASRTTRSLLDEFASLREQHVGMLRALTPEQLARGGDHDEAGEITVSDIVHQWAYHDLMHTKQIASILQPALAASMGNTRKFYDV